MRQALGSTEARSRGEVPVGTCIVNGDECWLPETELAPIKINAPRIVALREAARRVVTNRMLIRCYSTIEPCVILPVAAQLESAGWYMAHGMKELSANRIQSCDTDF